MNGKRNEDLDKYMRIRVAEDEPDVGYRPLNTQNAYFFGLGDTEALTKFTAEDTAYAADHCSEGVRWYNTHHAGAQIHFSTDSKKLRLHFKLNIAHNGATLTPNGQCGFNLYLYDEAQDRYNFVAVTGIPQNTTEIKSKLLEFDEKKKRHFILFMPMYAGARNIELGLDLDAQIWRETLYRTDAQILFYGTSITQGGCASRCGLIPPNVLSREFRMPVIDLGFSGNAVGEAELFTFMTHYDNLKVIILDYGANASMDATIERGLEILRAAMPTVPILVLSRLPQICDYTHPDGWGKHRENKAAALRKIIHRLRRKGDKNLYFMDGAKIFGDNWQDCLTDNGHPNDLGFARVTAALRPVLKRLLAE